tara:strand:- start:248 stop:568 length:321 start_codon:yes stop_codon:yes gene_type:complete
MYGMLNKYMELNNMKKYKNEGSTVTGSFTGTVYYIKKDTLYGWALFSINCYQGTVDGIESMMPFKQNAYDEIERLETEYQKSPAYLSGMLNSGLMTQAEYDNKRGA